MNSTARSKFAEHDEQAKLIQWAAYQRTEFGRLSNHIFAIPNGSFLAGNEKRRGMQMGLLKAVGLRPGAADLFVAIARRQWHGLFVEMKKPFEYFNTLRAAERAVSDNQREFGQHMRAAGYLWVVAYGFDRAQQIIEKYLAGRELRIIEGEIP